MEIKKGMKVKVNPSIATKKYLSNCYFNVSIPEKLKNISKGREYIITDIDLTKSTRDGKTHNCVNLGSFGWIPKEAILCEKNTLPELKIGTVLKTREGQYYIIANKEHAFEINYMGEKENICLWNKDTGKHCSGENFDIVATYNPKDMCGFGSVVPTWTETIPAREMTVAEIEKELGHGVKVVGEDGEWEF